MTEEELLLRRRIENPEEYVKAEAAMKKRMEQQSTSSHLLTAHRSPKVILTPLPAPFPEKHPTFEKEEMDPRG